MTNTLSVQTAPTNALAPKASLMAAPLGTALLIQSPAAKRALKNATAVMEQGLTSMGQLTRLISLLWAPGQTDAGVAAVRELLADRVYEDGVTVSEAMTAQAVAWLRDLHRSKSGVIRKHNPFGHRELSVLAAADRVVWSDTYSETGRGRPNPVFRVSGVVDGERCSFDYYLNPRTESGITVCA